LEVAVSELLVEVSRPSGAGNLAARAAGPESFGDRGEELASGLVRVAERFRGRIDELVSTGDGGARLDQVQLQFGLSLQAETGIVIAKAAAGTTFTATLTWSAGPRQAVR
jgi:hypothetical protein